MLYPTSILLENHSELSNMQVDTGEHDRMSVLCIACELVTLPTCKCIAIIAVVGCLFVRRTVTRTWSQGQSGVLLYVSPILLSPP